MCEEAMMFVPPIETKIVEVWEKMPSRYGCSYPYYLHSWNLVVSE